MFRALLIAAPTAVVSQDSPHLAQAWQANSVGDGQQGMTGLESYIYEDCPGKHGGNLFTETCMAGHIYNYGEDTCVKYEVDMGVHSQYTGTYYVQCESVDCCKGDRPDIKKWDIGQAKTSNITHFGTNDIQDLDGLVSGADTWNEIIKLPFINVRVNYTYYITQSGDDVISHRIDYSEPGDTHAQNGQILYGSFTVKHAEELDAFREVFKAPAACLKPNTLTCNSADTEKWDRKFFRGRGQVFGGTPVVV